MRECIIFGAGAYGDIAYKRLKSKLNIRAYADNDTHKQCTQKNGLSIIHPCNLSNYTAYDIIVAARFPSPIVQELQSMGICNDIYVFDPRHDNEKHLLYKIVEGELCVPEYMDSRYMVSNDLRVHYSELGDGVLRLFNTVLDWIKADFDKTVSIVEFGCGSGQFANMLFDNGYTNYIGYDFSEVAIGLAKEHNPEMRNCFTCADIKKHVSHSGTGIYIALEVLEHVKNDFDIVKKIPTGHTFIFSVPSFDSFNHVRKFENMYSVIERYKHIVDFTKSQRIETGYEKKFWFLMKGEKCI